MCSLDYIITVTNECPACNVLLHMSHTSIPHTTHRTSHSVAIIKWPMALDNRNANLTIDVSL